MSTAEHLLTNTRHHFREWNLYKKLLLFLSAAGFLISSFLYLTPPGLTIREKLAETVITTQHRNLAWIFVGAAKRDQMVQNMQDQMEAMGAKPIDMSKIQVHKRPVGDLIKVEDISGPMWKGKKMYVYDPKSIRVVVPSKQGEGERISSMVERTGAVAGVNGGGFDDPDGLGNGFAPIGMIMSGGNILYTGLEGSIPQHVVGFTNEGKLIVGKYSIDELLALKVTEAVSFYPRVIADGKPLITEGDGGWGRGPRTAIGQKADGTVIFIVIDGRQAHSVGATLREVQDEFMKDNVVNAGFLDGGASSELVTGEDGLITKPSSKYGERRLPSAFLVFDQPQTYKATNVWDGLDHIDPGGAATHPEYQAELKAKAEQKAAGTHSPSPSSKATPEAAKSRETQSPQESDSGSQSKAGGGTTAKPTATATPRPTAKPSEAPSAEPTARSTEKPAATAATAKPTPTATKAAQ